MKIGLFDNICEIKDKNFIVVDDYDSLVDMFDELNGSDKVCLDLETTGLDPLDSRIIGMGLSGDGRKIFYVNSRRFDDKRFFRNVSNFLCDKKLLGQNLKFDCKFLNHNGVKYGGILFDTLVAHQVLHPSDEGRHSLDALVYKYISKEEAAYKRRFKEILEKRNGDIEAVPLNVLAEYCCKDVKYTYQIYKILYKKAYRLGLLSLLENIEFPVVDVLAKIELNGMMIDKDYLLELKDKYTQVTQQLVRKIHSICGVEFDVNSPQQLSKILVNDFKIELPMTSKNNYSTDVKALRPYRRKHKVVDSVMQYRESNKLLTTYIEGLLSRVGDDGRIRTEFVQNGAVTGRFSSKNPNFQNIPARNTNEIRNVFIAPENKRLLSIDYSQIEIRVAAWYSRDPALLSALDSSDIYTEMAKIFMEKSEVTKEERNLVKGIVLGTNYGMGNDSFARSLNISVNMARKYRRDYFDRFKKLQKTIFDTVRYTEKHGHVTFWSGKKVEIPKKYSFKAFNTLIQGTAADIMKVALNKCYKAKVNNSLSCDILSTIHDEILLEDYADNTEHSLSTLSLEMVNDILPNFDVQLLVDTNVMERWEK